MNNSRAAVENKPTLAFAERAFSDRLAKKAAIMVKIQSTTNTKNSALIIGMASLAVMFEVLGVKPESDEIVDQLPFQDG